MTKMKLFEATIRVDGREFKDRVGAQDHKATRRGQGAAKAQGSFSIKQLAA